MDRRLAAIAGALLAGVGAMTVFGRRPSTPEESPETAPDLVQSLPEEQPMQVSQRAPLGMVVSTGWTPGKAIDLSKLQPIDATVDTGSMMTFQKAPETSSTRPLAEIYAEIVAGYPIDAGHMLDLRLALKEIAEAIEAGTLSEGTTVVEFDWMPAPGIMMNMAVSILATSQYVRANFSDLEGNLRAPELDVYIRGDEVRISPDTTARTVDIEDRRSEAAVTRAKLRAIADGITVHPGDAGSVMARCRITRNPLYQ